MTVRSWKTQQADLASALAIEDRKERLAAVKREVIQAVTEWESGEEPYTHGWPDDWARWERALSDAQGWPAPYDIDALMREHRTRLAREQKARADQAKAENDAKYPEHARLIGLNGDNQTVGRFIEWLGEKGYTICEWMEESPDDPEGFYPLGRSVESWIAEYFDINPARIESEKRAMLDEMREMA